MTVTTPNAAGIVLPARTSWFTRRDAKAARLKAAAPYCNGKVLKTASIVDALQAVLKAGDRVALEGDNQKQADFLSRALAKVDPAVIHDIHLLISTISRAEHLDIFETGIARKLDFSFAGPQSLRVAQLLEDGKLEIGRASCRERVS